MSKTASATLLTKHLTQASTGTIAVETMVGTVTVHLMAGDIIAAECPNDMANLLGRLAQDGYILGTRARELQQAHSGGEYIMTTLYADAGEEVMERMLHERFREDLCLFLGSDRQPAFTALGAVFADNIQMGHDSVLLLQSCWEDWHDASSVELDLEIMPGDTPPAPEDEHLVRLARGGVSVADLVHNARREPTAARASVARLLDLGVLTVPVAELDAEDLEIIELDESFEDDAPTQVEGSVLPRAFTDAPTVIMDMDDPTELGDQHLAELVPDEVLDDDSLEELEDVFYDDLDSPTEESPIPDVEPEAAHQQGAGDLSSLQAWLSHDHDLEDELEAFADHESSRGGAAGGAFSTQDHNLERVEVVALEPEPEILEAQDVPQSHYGAPPLNERAAVAKIDVANSVFRAYNRAFDTCRGRGAGRASLQLLVDGGPTRFTDLWQGVQVTDEGELGTRLVLRNLWSRPPTEHRRVLNEVLVNLIERALSVAADELPDDQFDGMYEEIAGYRQRLGL